MGNLWSWPLGWITGRTPSTSGELRSYTEATRVVMDECDVDVAYLDDDDDGESGDLAPAVAAIEGYMRREGDRVAQVAMRAASGATPEENKFASVGAAALAMEIAYEAGHPEWADSIAECLRSDWAAVGAMAKMASALGGPETMDDDLHELGRLAAHQVSLTLLLAATKPTYHLHLPSPSSPHCTRSALHK